MWRAGAAGLSCRAGGERYVGLATALCRVFLPFTLPWHCLEGNEKVSGTPKRGCGNVRVPWVLGLLRSEEQRYLLGPCSWQSTQLPRVVSASSMAYYSPCCLRLIQFKWQKTNLDETNKGCHGPSYPWGPKEFQLQVWLDLADSGLLLEHAFRLSALSVSVFISGWLSPCGVHQQLLA